MQTKKPEVLVTRPFREVVRAVLHVIPESFQDKPSIREELQNLLTEKDIMLQWKGVVSVMRYLGPANEGWKREVKQILRDPTHYRYVLRNVPEETPEP
jgi:hypothetical protein